VCVAEDSGKEGAESPLLGGDINLELLEPDAGTGAGFMQSPYYCGKKKRVLRRVGGEGGGGSQGKSQVDQRGLGQTAANRGQQTAASARQAATSRSTSQNRRGKKKLVQEKQIGAEGPYCIVLDQGLHPVGPSLRHLVP